MGPLSETDSIVIVGAGHGGVQLAASLREEGCAERIVLIGDEKEVPYQRPPLTKAFLKHETPDDGILLRGPDFYIQKKIELLRGELVTEIDRPSRRLKLASGSSLSYSRLVLATGGRQRPLPLDGASLDGVFSLRTLAEAHLIRPRLEEARDIVIIGAGFIGLEFAAAAVGNGRKVEVVELAARPMARAVTEPISAFFAQAHKSFGVNLNFGTSVIAINGRDGKVTDVALTDGRKLPADLVLVGIGLVPSVELALACGLDCPNGVRVDGGLATQDENIFAIGDCALHPNVFAGRELRLESVQNATDQARVLAKNLTGKAAVYGDVPWFWSDQGDLKLQMAGFLDGCDQTILRGTPEEKAFSIFGFKQGRLTGVESVNRPGDHMLARRFLAGPISVTPEQAGDSSVDLKALLKSPGR
jgi:3-phenylpropionate/trans-cinnamate dioxygenase ferredoxin reductase subunit